MNWKLWVVICVACLMVGTICGISIGIQKGQYMLFEGLAIGLKDSNINVTIDLNETQIIEGVNSTIREIVGEFK